MIGFLLVVLGIIFLLKNLGVITVGTWEVIWPVFLIVAGINFILRRSSGGLFYGERFGWRRKKIEEE